MLYDKIKKHVSNGVYPFHMPGHKRVSINPDLPYELDMTEIEGFDYLHNPSGCIKELEDKAARLYNAKRAFVLVNGATCGIMAAIGALASRGDRVLVARNCHISVYRAIKLFGLKPEYILPGYVKENGEEYPIFGSVSPESVRIKLEENPGIKLVIITSPTYEGVVSDIKSISEICRKHNARLFVDEAHGAHFPFSDSFPKSALDCGAGVSVTSLHKTLPALTQTALLLTDDSGINEKLQNMLAVFETSSPSYVLMSSVDLCLDYVEKNSFDKYIDRLKKLEAELDGLQNLSRLLRDNTESVFDHDRGKIVISTAHCKLSGAELAKTLRREYNIEVEMYSDDYIIAMTSVCDTDDGFDMLINALKSIDSACGYTETYEPVLIRSLPEKVYEPYESEIKDSDIAKKEYYIYPPGIPIVVTGERMTDDIINVIDKNSLL